MSANLPERSEQTVRTYVTQLFADFHTAALAYHNLEHTLRVVTRTTEIGEHYVLNEEEVFILFTAAWFHDTGQLLGPQAGHEEVSVRIVKAFFALHQLVPAPAAEAVEQCILATKFGSKPSNLLQEIICDADTYHLGTDDFRITDELMRQETILRGGNDDNWRERTSGLLLHHTFFTDYCRQKLDKGKATNLVRLTSS